MNPQGFTLIELLVVIAIVGVLAAVMLPQFITAQVRAYDAAASGCANDIFKKESIYLIDNGTFGTWAELNASSDTSPNCPANQIDVQQLSAPTQTEFSFTVKHQSGDTTYTVTRSSGVTP